MSKTTRIHFALTFCMGLLTTLPGCFALPESQSVDLDTVIYTDQNWSDDDRSWFYHASQGTVMMQSEWFLALEQPEVKFVGSIGLFRDDEYLSRFGFLTDKKSKYNPEGLPVGFAISEVEMPRDGAKRRVVGLTCAACHTGELHYAGNAVRVDGGVALIDVTTFQEALAASFMLTVKNPLRFDRFARRVLQDDYSEETKQALKEEAEENLERGLAEKLETTKRMLYDGHDGGYGRTDALAKIGNFVFGTKLSDDNLRVGDAPVRFPPIWDSVWFDWSQYNGSIEQPMVRNIGEALGVRALVNLDPNSERFLKTTVDIKGLQEIEALLSGEERLQGLQSPRWPEFAFGYINRTKAARGAQLYRDLCQRCHLPPLQSKEIWNDQYWVQNDAISMTREFVPPKVKRSFLDLEGVNLGIVGTDPGQATNFFSRYVNTGKIVLPSVSQGPWDRMKNDWEDRDWHQLKPTATYEEYPTSILPVGVALQKLTVALAQDYYDQQGYGKDQRDLFSGFRSPAARSPLEYRPRPLNGIWASPPYLHNGSIRTVFQLLSPYEEREKTFYTGTKQYDPVHLGYKSERIRGAFLYDTRVDGNRNTGHLFDALPIGDGVIGPRLGEEQRYEIIEFLKSMGPAGAPPQ